MSYTTYHQLVGPQGRAYRGYQGTRFDTPIAPRSTFETRSAMPPADEPADAVAQKTVAESPSPVDAVKDIAADLDRRAGIGGGSELVDINAPEANPFEQSLMRDSVTDIGWGSATKAGTNFGIASLLGAPTSMAAEYGLKSAIAPASGIGAISNMATTGLDVADMTNRLESYGIDTNEIDPAKMEAYNERVYGSTDYSKENRGPRHSTEYGPEGLAADIARSMEDRSLYEKTMDRLYTLAGIIGNPTSENAGTFDNGMRMHENLAAKAMKDPMLGPLLGKFTKDRVGAGEGNGGRSVPGTSSLEENEQTKRDFENEFGPFTPENYDKAIDSGWFEDRAGRESPSGGGGGLGPGGSGSNGLGGGSATDAMGGGYGDDSENGYW